MRAYDLYSLVVKYHKTNERAYDTTQRVNIKRIKHFPCCNLSILLVLKLTFTHELVERRGLKYYLIILFRILECNTPLNPDIKALLHYAVFSATCLAMIENFALQVAEVWL